MLLSDLTAANADNTGIANSGNLTLKRVVVEGNVATGLIRLPPYGSPGGILNLGTLTVLQSTIANNSTANSLVAAGIDSEAGAVIIIDSTISGNVANETSSAGGVGIYGGSLLLESSTITGNTPGGLDAFGYSDIIVNTIVAGNNSDDVQIGLGRLTSLGHNLIGMASAFAQKEYFIASDLVGTSAAPINPLLATALANNGGPTPTFAELAGSPAIAAGDPSYAPATDQRGFQRVINGTMDIGAYEYAAQPVVTAISPAQGLAAGGGTITITGSGFTGATAVDFAQTPATNVVVVSDSEITATIPAGAGDG